MAPPPPLSINMVSSSISTTLELQSLSKINYFANLSSDSNESDDEFDQYTISYPTNFVINESLPHFRTLSCFDSSIIILKVRILELEKIINIYQSNMDELKKKKT
jgi:hypothetical protein